MWVTCEMGKLMKLTTPQKKERKKEKYLYF